MNLWCWHVWKITNTEILSSPFEQYTKNITRIKGMSVPYEYFKKPCLVFYQCPKCKSEKVRRV